MSVAEKQELHSGQLQCAAETAQLHLGKPESSYTFFVSPVEPGERESIETAGCAASQGQAQSGLAQSLRWG